MSKQLPFFFRYLESADAAFAALEQQMASSLVAEVEQAARLFSNSAYRRDPWLWDLDWRLGSKRCRAGRLAGELYAARPEFSAVFADQGYPAWFQELSDELEDGRPHLAVSTAKRVVPKVLRLTWKGFPLHHDKAEKWGYLVPTEDAHRVLEQVEAGDIVTDFPLREYLSFVATGESEGSQPPEYTDMFIDQLPDYSDAGLLKEAGRPSPAKDAAPLSPGLDVGLPGVRFHKLPHKNGAKYRVGNPLGKDFLAACEEGGALASKQRDLAGALLRLSIQLAYWRSVRDRLDEQVMGELPHAGLPQQLKQHPEYNPKERYGAILPALIVSGKRGLVWSLFVFRFLIPVTVYF